MTVYTVGYQNSSIDKFVTFLKSHKISEIVDVRKTPMSRKKGFSKNKLAEALAAKNIGYALFTDLGVPQAWRKAAHSHRITRAKMFRDYKEKILPFRDHVLKEVRAKIKDHRVALLCFEHEADDCHRLLVANYLKTKTRGLKIVNLEP